MRRRTALQTLAAFPVLALGQEPVVPPRPVARAVEETPKIESTVADSVTAPVARFFSAHQYTALQRLCDVILPAIGETPGALAAHAPEFLDFLLSRSTAERQKLYRDGLDRFAAQADTAAALAPLRLPWTYDDPPGPYDRFLRAAKDDILTATVNSREWIEVVSRRNRGAGGTGMYWFPVDQQ